ncbi:CLUMA_CG016060, isoform A [Clunio marinus]|uniref:CLUMA_CG016060, isoform A n=1 Tax=Clunio marinus TaxID=568069 RepID=A0A1J1IW84_9DIPT|nr:CLUMA_CG016060, isoform A [Clunio marinus]
MLHGYRRGKRTIKHISLKCHRFPIPGYEISMNKLYLCLCYIFQNLGFIYRFYKQHITSYQPFKKSLQGWKEEKSLQSSQARNRKALNDILLSECLS